MHLLCWLHHISNGIFEELLCCRRHGNMIIEEVHVGQSCMYERKNEDAGSGRVEAIEDFCELLGTCVD